LGCSICRRKSAIVFRLRRARSHFHHSQDNRRLHCVSRSTTKHGCSPVAERNHGPEYCLPSIFYQTPPLRLAPAENGHRVYLRCNYGVTSAIRPRDRTPLSDSNCGYPWSTACIQGECLMGHSRIPPRPRICGALSMIRIANAAGAVHAKDIARSMRALS